MVTLSYSVNFDTSLKNAIDIITKRESYFITKYYKSLLKNTSDFLLENVTVLFQNETVTTIYATFIIKSIGTTIKRTQKL